MIGIGSFFERFRSREIEEIRFLSIVIDVIKDVLRFDLDPKSIVYTDAILYIKISPAAKGAIFLKKEEILNKIREKTSRKISDIR